MINKVGLKLWMKNSVQLKLTYLKFGHNLMTFPQLEKMKVKVYIFRDP